MLSASLVPEETFDKQTVVPTPADHGLPYQDLTLDTEDGVKLKSFLLMQRRHLPGEEPRDSDADVAEEDRRVSFLLPVNG